MIIINIVSWLAVTGNGLNKPWNKLIEEREKKISPIMTNNIDRCILYSWKAKDFIKNNTKGGNRSWKKTDY